jgi:hypothetical protein
MAGLNDGYLKTEPRQAQTLMAAGGKGRRPGA